MEISENSGWCILPESLKWNWTDVLVKTDPFLCPVDAFLIDGNLIGDLNCLQLQFFHDDPKQNLKGAFT